MHAVFATASASCTLFAALAIAPPVAPAQEPAKPPAPAAAAGFKKVAEWKLGGEGGWDYLTVDGAGKRVYVSRSTHVMVVDLEKGTLVGDIPDTQRVHGIALAPDCGRGVITAGGTDEAVIFDVATLKVSSRLKTGKGPDATLYEPTTKRVYAFCGRGAEATVIDVAKGEVAGTIALGGQPEAGVADGAGHVYVNLEDKSEIVAIDAAKMQVTAHWSIAPGEGPSGLALDVAHHVLFSGCHNQKMVMVDAQSGKVITTLPIGGGVDGCAFDPALACAFSSNGDGTMTVVHEDAPDQFTVVENVATKRGSKTMALDPATHRAYLGAADFEAPAAAPAAGNGGRPPRPQPVAGSFSLLVFSR
jgi:outer membrane protein assembly factor BamB